MKSRDDFPDAFVWQTIKDIATEEGTVNAVIADNNLRRAASEIAGVVTFSSLEAFIESPPIQDLFPENFVRKHEVEILNVFKYSAWVFDRPIAKGLESELLETSVPDTVHDNVDEANIGYVESVDNVNIDFISAQYFGDNVFRIPFKAGVWAALDYFLMESTYYGMSHDERILIEVQDPEWTESTMWVTETRYLKVEGQVGILIDVNQLIKNSKDDRLDTNTLLYGSEITVDELDSLEIAAR
jgi:hypothetical protein